MLVNELFDILNKIAPISLSHKLIEQGSYDNSGIIVDTGVEIKKVLFSLDLTKESVKTAKKIKAQAIVTHHPAIYNPIKNLSVSCPVTSALVMAQQNGISVISMHLNLDVCKGGIDDCLAEGLGAKSTKTLSPLDSENGYGKLFEIKETKLSEYVSNVKKTFNTNKIVVYGKNNLIKKVASFCGGGAEYAENVLFDGTDIDLFITSDMPHHVIKEFVESGKNIILLPHYASENYGFNKFYNRVKEQGVDAEFLTDVRFL